VLPIVIVIIDIVVAHAAGADHEGGVTGWRGGLTEAAQGGLARLWRSRGGGASQPGHGFILIYD